MTCSVKLDREDKFEIGQKFFKPLESRVDFS